MSLPQYTIQQVATHNENHPNNKWAVIHGDVYRISSIPFNSCAIAPVALEAQVVADNNPDVTAVFAGRHQDANTVRTLQRAQGCHMGTIAQAPAGTQQRQPAHVAQPGHSGQNGQGQNGQGQNGQPDADDDDDDDDGGTAAERRRREEARNRRLRKTYNPLRQDPDDADEYPADAVAMGYVPDLEGRRWREKRMRLSRFIQFNDIPAIDEEDLDPLTAQWLDLDFAKEIRYQRNLKGGEARGCTGSFRVARPPPPRSQLRPRNLNRRDGGQGQPPPRDPPDSDASSDDDDDDSPSAPALRARQIQVEGRVRQWFPSNSNRTGPGPTHLATPPVTPHNRLAQQTLEPPAPPPPDPQQLTPEDEQMIAQRRKDERDAADKAIRDQQLNATAVKERMDKSYPLKQKDKVQGPGQGTQDKVQKPRVQKKPQPPKPSEGQKKQQEEQRKQKEAKAESEQKRQQREKAAQEEEQRKQKRQQEQKAAENKAADKKRQSIEEEAKRLSIKGQKIVQDAKDRTEEQRRNQETPKNIDDMREQVLQMAREIAKQQERERAEALAKEKEEARRSQAEAKAVYEKAVQEEQRKQKRQQEQNEAKNKADEQKAQKQERERAEALAKEKQMRADYEKFVTQENRKDNMISQGYTLEQAIGVIKAHGPLLENPYKKGLDNKGTTTTPQGPKKVEATPATTPRGERKKAKATPYTPTPKSPPKRPAETTKEDQTPIKKPRTDKTPETQKDQAVGKSGGGGGGGGGDRFSDANRPSWSTQKKRAPRQKSVMWGDFSDEDSSDELAPASSIADRKGSAKGGPADPPRPAPPVLPADPPTGPTTAGPSAGGNTSTNTAVPPADTAVAPANTTVRPTDTPIPRRPRKARVPATTTSKASQSAKASPRPSGTPRRLSGEW